MNGIRVYANKHTHESKGTLQAYNATVIKEGDEIKLGGFKIKPFNLEHDVPSFGFLIFHKEMGRLVFITDTSHCKYKFNGLNQVILEANYSKEIMMQRFQDGDINALVRDRVFNSHMSFESAIEFLQANDLSQMTNLVYIHLSKGNSDPDLFVKETIKAIGRVPHIAEPKMKISINLTAF